MKLLRPSLSFLVSCVYFLAVLFTSQYVSAQTKEDSLKESAIIHNGFQALDVGQLSNAVVHLEAKDLASDHANNIWQMLRGRVAGLSVARFGSDPEGAYAVRMRGVHSLGYSEQAPLVVVDGVPGYPLDLLDPQDVASFTILKDAASAAAWGGRGNNGVILIQTKKGSNTNQTSIEYQGTYTQYAKDWKLAIQGSEEYLRGRNANDLGDRTDWLEEITRRAHSQAHHVRLSGGSENFSYRASLNFRDLPGVVKNSGYQQLNGRAILEQRLWKNKLSFQVNLSANQRKSDYIDNFILQQAIIFNPTAPIRDEGLSRWDGYFQQVLFNYYNPVAMLEQNIDEGISNHLQGSFRAVLQPIQGLRIEALAAQQQGYQERGRYFDKQSFYGGEYRNGLAHIMKNETSSIYANVLASYSFSLGKLHLSSMLGHSYQFDRFSSFSVNGGDFLTDAFSYHNLGAAQDFANGRGDVNSGRSVHKLSSLYGNVGVQFGKIGSLLVSMRRDGSSRLGINQRWGTFPAISARVNVGEFWDRLPIGLRASWGKTGNLPAQANLSQDLYRLYSPYFYDGEYLLGPYQVQQANEDLSWEKGQSLNMGIDFSLLNRRFQVQWDVYSKTSSELINLINLPNEEFLARSMYRNGSTIKSSGMEIALQGKVMENRLFSWNAAWRLDLPFSNVLEEFESRNVLTWEEAYQDLRMADFFVGCGGTPHGRLIEGESLGNMWGPWVNEDDPLDDDGGWNFRTVEGEEEGIIGNALPDMYVGLDNHFQFGKLEVDLFFRGVFGHQVYNTYRYYHEDAPVLSGYYYNRVQTKYRLDGLTDGAQLSNWHVENASFLRLDRLNIAYRFDSGIFKQTPMKVFANATNIFTLTGYSGNNPEPRLTQRSHSQDINSLSMGMDSDRAYPLAKSFSLGLTLSL